MKFRFMVWRPIFFLNILLIDVLLEYIYGLRFLMDRQYPVNIFSVYLQNNRNKQNHANDSQFIYPQFLKIIYLNKNYLESFISIR